MRKRNYSLDGLINEVEEREKRYESRMQDKEIQNGQAEKQKIRIGFVEKYYQRLGVAAIKIENNFLKIDDIIEIGNEEEAVRQRISSMQINRVNVESAKSGDSVGVSLKYSVKEGSDVYKVIKV